MTDAPYVVFDVTGLGLRSWKQLTGIPRIHLEIAAAVADAPGVAVRFCAFDRAKRVFEPVAGADVQATAARSRPTGSPNPADTRSNSLVRRSTRRAADAAPPAVADHLRKAGYHSVKLVHETRRAIADRVAARRHSVCMSEEWDEHTTYCSVGPDWIGGDLEYLLERKRARGFRTVLTVYDLIPVVAPQYFMSAHDMTPHFRALLDASDTVLAISDATERDLREFAATNRIDMPRTARLPLASGIADRIPVPPRDTSIEALRGRYVLSVGSIEIRKNQHLLLDVWEMLVDALPRDDVPPLIVAGQRGWLAEETMARLTRTPSLHGIVRFVEAPSDDEVAWLYANCTFTVFPARYEGWGLPVSESLDFGKLCITSDGSSLPEAGEGLTDLLSPFDRIQWRDTILRCWTDREHARGAASRYRGDPPAHDAGRQRGCRTRSCLTQ